MRKPAFCLCKNKGADQLHGYLISTFVFATKIVQSLFFLNPKNFKSLAIFCSCTAIFMSDLVRNTEDGFSRDGAQMVFETRYEKTAFRDF